LTRDCRCRRRRETLVAQGTPPSLRRCAAALAHSTTPASADRSPPNENSAAATATPCATGRSVATATVTARQPSSRATRRTWTARRPSLRHGPALRDAPTADAPGPPTLEPRSTSSASASGVVGDGLDATGRECYLRVNQLCRAAATLCTSARGVW
jgi:hypothetical protein